MEVGFYAGRFPSQGSATKGDERRLWRAFLRVAALGVVPKNGPRAHRTEKRSGSCGAEEGGLKTKRATRCRCRAIQCSYTSKRARACQEDFSGEPVRREA